MEVPKPYREYLAQFDRMIGAATAISQGAAGRRSETNKHYWASILFTRLCGAGVSLLLSLPRNRFVRSSFEHWDYGAIAAISRQFLETYLLFFYLCVDPIDDDEWQCRWNILNLHDCISRIRMFALQNNLEEMHKFDEVVKDIVGRLKGNKYFISLRDKRKNELLKGRKLLLLNQDEILRRIGMDINEFRFYYEFLSAQVHSLPLSFYRTGESNRGRGLENRVEKNYICITLEYLDQFVVRAIREMEQLFPGASNDIIEASRKLIFKK